MALKKILVTGGTGLLGRALVESCPDGFEICITHIRESSHHQVPFLTARMDVTEKKQVIEVFERTRPEVVIHMAGVGSVDFAEKNQSLAWTINVGGTQNVIEACRQFGVKLIYISSNAVFSGEHPPYKEESPRLPVNYYGRLKVEAENLVQSNGLEYSIVRPILMYGWHYAEARPNPVTTWLHSLENHLPVKVVTDRFSQPLFVEDWAIALWQIIDKNRTGVYHLSGSDRLSLYEFALQTAEIFCLEKGLLEGVPSSYFPEIAPRPVDTSFSTLKAQAELQIHFRGTLAGLRRMQATRPDWIEKNA